MNFFVYACRVVRLLGARFSIQMGGAAGNANLVACTL